MSENKVIAMDQEAFAFCIGKAIRESAKEIYGEKLCEGLYFAGEVLDVDAYTGGFNLQIAFSTGHLAGESAS